MYRWKSAERQKSTLNGSLAFGYIAVAGVALSAASQKFKNAWE
jgi:hypothetical protein